MAGTRSAARADVTLSVIVPTLGRPTLARALDSVLPQLAKGDELVLVADPAGNLRRVSAVARHRSLGYLKCASDGRGKGGAQRQAGIAAARGSHLCFLDDDDTYLPDTLALFRAAACARPAIFRVRLPDRMCWAEPVLARDNIAGIALLVPNVPHQLGSWDGWYGIRGGDFTFLRDCVALMGTPVWREEIVARVNG